MINERVISGAGSRIFGWCREISDSAPNGISVAAASCHPNNTRKLAWLFSSVSASAFSPPPLQNQVEKAKRGIMKVRVSFEIYVLYQYYRFPHYRYPTSRSSPIRHSFRVTSVVCAHPHILNPTDHYKPTTSPLPSKLSIRARW